MEPDQRLRSAGSLDHSRTGPGPAAVATKQQQQQQQQRQQVPSVACYMCGAPNIDAAWLKAFDVALCCSCKGQDGLISKSRAKSLYLLNDNDLRNLGSIEKPNPQHKGWSSMRMYLCSQVKKVAVKKHGSISHIEAVKDRRADEKFEQQAQQRKRGPAAEAQRAKQDEEFEARVEAKAAKLAREAKEAERVQIEEFEDPETGAKRRRHGPQMADVEVETI